VNTVARLKEKGYITVVGRRKTTHQYEYNLNVELIHATAARMHQMNVQQMNVHVVNINKFTTCTSSSSPRALNPLDEPSVESLDSTPEPERIPVVYVNDEYTEVDEIKESKPKYGENYRSLMSAVASVCRMDIGIKTQAGQVGKAARELDEGGYTPDQVYDFLDWWKREDWRWQKEKRNPSPHEILTTISRSIVKAEPKMTDEELRRIGYIE
jgi:hypothetical protein